MASSPHERLLALRASDDRIGWPGTAPSAPRRQHGWFLDTHRRVFTAVLRPENEVKTIVELGSWYGASTTWLARHAAGAHIYAIDIWDNEFILRDNHYTKDADGKFEHMLDAHPLYETFLRNLWPQRSSVTPMRMKTLEGLELLASLGVTPEVVYIDADHHYEAVYADVKRCLELFPDAILVGDDYGHYKDVENAVVQNAAAFGKTIHVDAHHCWTYAALRSSTGTTFTPGPELRRMHAPATPPGGDTEATKEERSHKPAPPDPFASMLTNFVRNTSKRVAKPGGASRFRKRQRQSGVAAVPPLVEQEAPSAGAESDETPALPEGETEALSSDPVRQEIATTVN